MCAREKCQLTEIQRIDSLASSLSSRNTLPPSLAHLWSDQARAFVRSSQTFRCAAAHLNSAQQFQRFGPVLCLDLSDPLIGFLVAPSQISYSSVQTEAEHDFKKKNLSLILRLL
jgi:hypothetical protein